MNIKFIISVCEYSSAYIKWPICTSLESEYRNVFHLKPLIPSLFGFEVIRVS